MKNYIKSLLKSTSIGATVSALAFLIVANTYANNLIETYGLKDTTQMIQLPNGTWQASCIDGRTMIVTEQEIINGTVCGIAKAGHCQLVSSSSQQTAVECSVNELSKNKSDLDVVWVVDNSGSMEFLQQTIVSASKEIFQNFMNLFSNIDWKMGLVSTDTQDKPYLGFETGALFTKHASEAELKFASAISKLGTQGFGIERPLDSLWTHLSQSSFQRKETPLAVIIVSDESEQSSLNVDDFIKLVKTQSTDLKVYGLVSYTKGQDGVPYKGSKFEELITKTNGRSYNNEAMDKTVINQMIQDMATDFTPLLNGKASLELTGLTNPTLIKVSYNGQYLLSGPQNVGGKWIVENGNILVFHSLDFVTDPTIKIKIEY